MGVGLLTGFGGVGGVGGDGFGSDWGAGSLGHMSWPGHAFADGGMPSFGDPLMPSSSSSTSSSSAFPMGDSLGLLSGAPSLLPAPMGRAPPPGIGLPGLHAPPNPVFRGLGFPGDGDGVGPL